MLDIAFDELACRAAQQMFSHQARARRERAPSHPAADREIRRRRPTGSSRFAPQMRHARIWYSSQPLASTLSDGSGVSTCTAPSVRCQYCRTLVQAHPERPPSRGSAAPACALRPGCGPCRGERRFPCLARRPAQREPGWRRKDRAPVRPCPKAAPQPSPRDCPAMPLRPMNSVRSPLMVRSDAIGVEEGNPPGEFAVVRISREQRSARGSISVTTCIAVFAPQIAQHPFDIAGRRELAAADPSHCALSAPRT